jgi:tetratricopeptide (TPR) repeat protein
VAGAIRAMRGAESFAGTQADRAWAAYQLGELLFHSGRVDDAAAEYRRSSALAPGYVPPQAGLARIAWARGDVDVAIERYLEVTRRYPAPEHVIALGDLYASVNEPELAQEQYDLVETIRRLLADNGVNVDLEFALFAADHGDPVRAVATARAEWARRHSIHVADALAWALHAAGRDRAAAPFAARSLALGTRNALFLYHAGMIRLGLGERDAARRLLERALEVNPHFSIRYSAQARATVRSLRGPA